MKNIGYVVDRICAVILIVSTIVLTTSCRTEHSRVGVLSQEVEKVTDVITGAQNIAEYLPILQDKRIGMVVNQTSMVGNKHLVDTLRDYKADIKMIFAPEHGFRGEADAGEHVTDSRDAATGIPVRSLYGSKKKPSAKDLADIDVMVFDIQDVGARFYTYISTLHYIMEACAESGIPVIVLDRPNPNAHYVDGPILTPAYRSFVGMHPVPVVYGMTIGEYALMINGEGWLPEGVQADLTVIKNRNYTHSTYYRLPIKPSPNLPNIRSILLYPSLCFFEGTTISIGRGTKRQFQVVGHPDYAVGADTFTPVSRQGAKYPKHEDQLCHGIDLSKVPKGQLYDAGSLDLSYLISMYAYFSAQGENIFLENGFFDKLAGNDQLRKQITLGLSEEEIRATWQSDLDAFKEVRAQYLLYAE